MYVLIYVLTCCYYMLENVTITKWNFHKRSPCDVIVLILKTSASKNVRIFIQDPIDWVNGWWKEAVQKPKVSGHFEDVRAAGGKIDVPMSRNGECRFSIPRVYFVLQSRYGDKEDRRVECIFVEWRVFIGDMLSPSLSPIFSECRIVSITSHQVQR